MKTVAVVGGGASGFAAAITVARAQSDCAVTIYERLEKPLKKILATGNGRCNLTNTDAGVSDYRGDAAFAAAALAAFPAESTRAFFSSMGLCTKTEAAGRVYPMSGQASSVRDVLLCEAKRLGIFIRTSCEIQTIEPHGDGFLLNGEYPCTHLILCAGGSAAPQHGTDGGAFRLLEALQHTVCTPAPALTALVCKNFPKQLKGVRCDCAVQLFLQNQPVAQTVGEVQFTEYGLSGIPIMQMSRYVAVSQQPARLLLNCLPTMSAQSLAAFLKDAVRQNPEKSAETLASGLLPRALGTYLLLQSGIRKDSPIGTLPTRSLDAFGQLLQAFEVEVLQPRGFDFAQVTAGGAACAEFDPQTMRSKIHPHLYVCGEALNIDGDCGGFNLQWAWSSGRAAGEAVIKE